MEIKNLAQLKRVINEKKCFVIEKHYIKPEFTGQRRQPNIVQTNGFFSIVPGEPENYVSTANYGKGYWVDYGKASNWVFEDGLCKLKDTRHELTEFVWEIRFED